MEAVQKEKRLRSMKKHFAFEASEETIADATKRLEATFFSVVVVTAIESFQDRFETGGVRARFGELFSFQQWDDQKLCNLYDLCRTLSTGDESYIDGFGDQKLDLRSSMGQDRLTCLAIISISHEMGKQLSHEDISDDFASTKNRKLVV